MRLQFEEPTIERAQRFRQRVTVHQPGIEQMDPRILGRAPGTIHVTGFEHFQPFFLSDNLILLAGAAPTTHLRTSSHHPHQSPEDEQRQQRP
jgi:hypothetical protein